MLKLWLQKRLPQNGFLKNDKLCSSVEFLNNLKWLSFPSSGQHFILYFVIIVNGFSDRKLSSKPVLRTRRYAFDHYITTFSKRKKGSSVSPSFQGPVKIIQVQSDLVDSLDNQISFILFGHWDSHPSSTKVKNAWNSTSTPPYIFRAWCSIKHRIHLHDMVLMHKDNFTLTLSTEKQSLYKQKLGFFESHITAKSNMFSGIDI
jgi:hypothetical protein